VVVAQRDLDVAALGDLEGIGHRGGVVVEDGAHLLARLHEEALAVELEALRVVEVRRRADAEQRLVVGVVVLLQVVGVVGGDQRQAQVRRHLDQLGIDLVLGGNAVTLELEVVAVREDRGELLDQAPGTVDLAAQDGAAHHRGQTARGGDQPLAALAQQVEVDARLVVEALEVALGDQVDQVAVAGLVHRQQQQVVDGVEATGIALALLLVEARARGQVDLAAEDRLDVVGEGLLVELDRPEQVAVVRHRHGGHPQGLGALEQRVVLDRPV
jgi:hypothetical protein